MSDCHVKLIYLKIYLFNRLINESSVALFLMQFEDCTFEWLYWPQAREPFSTETLAYIKSLDAVEVEDIALLKFHGWELSPQCAGVLQVSTMLLKKGAERALTA